METSKDCNCLDDLKAWQQFAMPDSLMRETCNFSIAEIERLREALTEIEACPDDIQLARDIATRALGNSGHETGVNDTKCGTCNGTGFVGGHGHGDLGCDDCDGTGQQL